jgi:hypothetical protein
VGLVCLVENRPSHAPHALCRASLLRLQLLFLLDEFLERLRSEPKCGNNLVTQALCTCSIARSLSVCAVSFSTSCLYFLSASAC